MQKQNPFDSRKELKNKVKQVYTKYLLSLLSWPKELNNILIQYLFPHFMFVSNTLDDRIFSLLHNLSFGSYPQPKLVIRTTNKKFIDLFPSSSDYRGWMKISAVIQFTPLSFHLSVKENIKLTHLCICDFSSAPEMRWGCIYIFLFEDESIEIVRCENFSDYEFQKSSLKLITWTDFMKSHSSFLVGFASPNQLIVLQERRLEMNNLEKEIANELDFLNKVDIGNGLGPRVLIMGTYFVFVS